MSDPGLTLIPILNGGWTSNFFPDFNAEFGGGALRGDPFCFVVHWMGSLYVAEDKTYSYSMGSNDDSWLFIDDRLTLDLGHMVTRRLKKKA